MPPKQSDKECKQIINTRRIPWNKGKVGIYSEETRNRISSTLKSKKIQPPSRKGYKPSEKNIMVLKNAWKSRKRSEQNRINSSLGARRRLLEGRCNLDRGGLTGLKENIRDSVYYRIWRKNVFERDEYSCVDCGDKNGNGHSVFLEADHLEGLAFLIHKHGIVSLDQAMNCIEIWNINNGATRCRKCHRKTLNFGLREARRLEKIRNEQ